MEKQKRAALAQLATSNILNLRTNRRKFDKMRSEVYMQLVKIMKTKNTHKVNKKKSSSRKINVLSPIKFKRQKNRVISPNVRNLYENSKIKNKIENPKLTLISKEKMFAALQLNLL